MHLATLSLVLTALMVAGFASGRSKAMRVVGGRAYLLHSIPVYHGAFVALWAGLPAAVVAMLWLLFGNWIVVQTVLAGMPDALTNVDEQGLNLLKADLFNLVSGVAAGRVSDPSVLEAAERFKDLIALGNAIVFGVGSVLAVAGLWYGQRRVSRELRARNKVENTLNVFLIVCSLVAIVTTIGIVLSLLFEAMHFFAAIGPFDFLFGLHWSPQMAIRADQVGSSGSFGAVPLFVGTLLITVIAMMVAVPVGLMSAIYMSEYADRHVRTALKPILEVLAGIPTVVYGFFAALTMAPFIRGLGARVNEAAAWAGFDGFRLDVSSESALAAGLVMGVMIIPFVSSLSDDVINAVPQSLRDGSYGLGATRSETIRQVILPAALPGIVAAVMLAISRAIGETMIVTMAAGLAANLTANPLQAVTTVTTQIATLLVGDQEFNSPKTLAAFGLGLVLFLVTLTLNVIALKVVQKYREKYD